jgi:phosphoglycerate dehydrogenase-like enzyme
MMMGGNVGKMKIAVLDDYQNVALELADWSEVQRRCSVTVFNDHLTDPDKIADRLSSFDCVVVMRERTPMTKALLERLPNLKLLITTGGANASIDLEAATRLGIQVEATETMPYPTSELTWALILTLYKRIPQNVAAMHDGRWQDGLSLDLRGQTLGLIGLGRLGTMVARVANAFRMNVIAWSRSLTEQDAIERGARRVELDDLLRQADIVSIHTQLSERTRGLLGDREFQLMKPSAFLINTSRGPIVEQEALISALTSGAIAAAATDVYETEPFGSENPLMSVPNLLTTPHIGYVTKPTYEVYFRDVVANIEAWLEGKVLRPLNKLG